MWVYAVTASHYDEEMDSYALLITDHGDIENPSDRADVIIVKHEGNQKIGYYRDRVWRVHGTIDRNHLTLYATQIGLTPQS